MSRMLKLIAEQNRVLVDEHSEKIDRNVKGKTNAIDDSVGDDLGTDNRLGNNTIKRGR